MAIIEMTLTDYMFEQIKEFFDIDIELIKGEHAVKEDGTHWFKIEVAGEKEAMFEAWLRDLMKVAMGREHVRISIMGTPINPN